MNYISITSPDIENGLGFRVTLWISGCSLSCPGCHNKQTHDFNAGHEFTEETYEELKQRLQKPYISGLTLSGGNPLESPEGVLRLVRRIKEELPEKNIWLYSGFTWEEILENPKMREILEYIEVLVDGRFIIKQRDISLAFRGSTNQRIIDVQESLKKGEVVLYK